jgi:hypothetical protein
MAVSNTAASPLNSFAITSPIVQIASGARCGLRLPASFGRDMLREGLGVNVQHAAAWQLVVALRIHQIRVPAPAAIAVTRRPHAEKMR